MYISTHKLAEQKEMHRHVSADFCTLVVASGLTVKTRTDRKKLTDMFYPIDELKRREPAE